MPKRVFAHGFLFNRGEKMSKSVGNVVDPFTITAHYGVDQVRYLLHARGVVRAGRRLQPRGDRQPHQRRSRQRSRQSGAALAVDDRPLCRRASCRSPARFSAEDEALLAAADGLLERCRTEMDAAGDPLGADGDLAGGRGREPLFRGAGAMGASEDRSGAHGDGALRHGRGGAAGRILVQPVMPASAARLLDFVAVPADARSFASLGEAGRLKPGAALPAAEPVFPRYVEKDESGKGD